MGAVEVTDVVAVTIGIQEQALEIRDAGYSDTKDGIATSRRSITPAPSSSANTTLSAATSTSSRAARVAAARLFTTGEVIVA